MNDIRQDFPKLLIDGYSTTSPQTQEHNCIAWAAGDDSRWWWPDNQYVSYWPENVERTWTIHAFVEVFESFGYSVCDKADFEEGFTKIAIFADRRNKPTHAARQTSDGLWTSKLGNYEDIEHSLYSLEGPCYGQVVCIMKKRLE